MEINRLKTLAQGMLKDQAVKNRLIDYTEEYTIGDIKSASDLALLEINGTAPFATNYTIENCPDYLLILGTGCYLLSNQIALKSRNTSVINDGGIIVNREGNINLYINLHTILRQRFEDQVEAYKGWLNLKAAM